MKIYQNFKTGQKLLFSSLAYMVPIAMLLYFLTDAYNKDIEFTEKEILGAKTVKPFAVIIPLLNEHQQLSHLVKENILETKEHHAELETRIDSAFNELFKVLGETRDQININKELAILYRAKNIQPDTLLERWQNIKRYWTKYETEELDKMYDELQHSNESFISYVGNETNLILDPDLDSYYLMDISLQLMPIMQAKIANSQLAIKGIALSDSAVDRNSEIVVMLTEMLEREYLQRLNEGVKITLREDKNFYGTSETLKREFIPAHVDYHEKLESYLEKIRDFAQRRVDKREIVELFMLSRETFEAGKNFWQVALDELIIQLELRKGEIKAQRNFALIVSVIALLLSTLFVMIISRNISITLKTVSEISSHIAQGKIGEAINDIEASRIKRYITEDKEPKDELLLVFKSIQIMTDNLYSLLEKVKSTGEEVADSVLQISGSAKEIEATVAEQASSTNQVNTTSKEISANAGELALTMEDLNSSVAAMIESIGINLESIRSIDENISDYSQTNRTVSENLHSLILKTQNINNIITTITKIANQTNLLSLNAAIEAEKAGEYGAGFAVVAQEIRRLADQTAIAALEIEDQIRSMQESVETGVHSVEEHTSTTENTIERVSDVNSGLADVIKNTGKLGPQISLVNSGMQMQSEGADQIRDAMSQLSDTASQTRDNIIYFNTATAKLRGVVEEMQTELRKFNFERKS
jgi:methyl-accepting chemotaxis protein